MEERLCWWCCHPWEGNVVLHMPYKLDPKTHTYLTMGQFCSWNCVSAYNKDRHNEHKTSTINSFIGVLHKKMTGKLKFPKPAPSRYALKAFGGTLTIEEFRNLNGENIPIHHMSMTGNGIQVCTKFSFYRFVLSKYVSKLI